MKDVLDVGPGDSRGIARTLCQLGGEFILARRGHLSRRMSPTPYGVTTGDSVKVGQGPAQLTYDPVMRLNASERHMLLSRIYTDYTNQGWTDRSEETPPVIRQRGLEWRIDPDPFCGKWPLVRQQILLIGPWDVLPAYDQLSGIQVWSRVQGFTFDNHGCARMSPSRAMTMTYAAVSHVAPSLNGLADGPDGLPYPPDPDPPEVPREVSDLARDLKGPTDVETTKNVVSYLGKRCTYDLNAPAVPDGRDAVDFFLFGSRAGYCDLFATSAALLLQMDGIPARYCIGFLPGEAPGTDRVTIVTAADAHAWVQVFIRGRGWIPVDPTPPGFTGQTSAPAEVRLLLSRLHLQMYDPGLTGFLLVLAGLVAAALLYGNTPEARKRRMASSAGLGREHGKLLFNYREMEKLMGRWGFPRQSHETPFEYARRLGSAGLPPEVKTHIESLTRTFVEVRYGHIPNTNDHSATLEAIRAGVRRWKRRTGHKEQAPSRTAPTR